MIRRLSTVAAGLGLMLASVGCGGSSSSTTPSGERVGSVGDAIEVAAGAPGQANAAACTLDRSTLESAVDLYATLNGAHPSSEDDLLTAQLIREPSTLHDIDPTGHVVAAPTSGCP